MSQNEPLLTSKELATALRRHVTYVYAMRLLGFEMPGGTATLSEARAWLVSNRPPRGNGRKRNKTE
jgi:hypothetical protein